MLTTYKSFSKKVVRLLPAASILFLQFGIPVQGANTLPTQITRADWKADESLLTNESPVFVQVKEIKVIRMPVITNDASSYVAGLYFYVASTYGEDMPFHYLVSGKGEIFQGAAGGYGVQLQKHVSNGILTIGYVPDSSNPLSYMGKQTISKLLLYLHDQTGVGLNNINAKGYIFDGNLNDQNPDGNWKKAIDGIKTDLSKSISNDNQDIIYSASLSNPQISKSQAGNQLISVDLQNNSSQPLYGRIYAGSDTPSPLYFLSHWISNERTTPQDITNIQTNKKVTINFEISNSPPSGEYDISFYTDSNKINGDSLHISIPKDNSAASVKVNSNPQTNNSVAINSSNTKTITIINTPTGSLNVRSDGTYNGKVIGSVNPGASFTVLNQITNSGGTWYQIQYDSSNTGWISSKYTR